jgi:hypothetical protein
MNCPDFELPTPDSVRIACEQFDNDEETKISEPALNDLFARYPTNASESQVLLKVVSLNVFYSTRLPSRAPDRPTVFDIARCIPTLDMDRTFEERSLEIVNTLSTTQFPGKKNVNRFSFATKYASWHRQGFYAIWDSKVQKYFTCLRALHRAEWDKFADGFKLSSNDWGYPEFHGLMTRFRESRNLGAFTFKQIDKFLWLHGSKL